MRCISGASSALALADPPGADLDEFPGVVGLTTAIVIQEKGGYNVTLVAEQLPTDPKSINYTSHWAVSLFATYCFRRLTSCSQGAHHVYNDTNNRLQRGPSIETATLRLQSS